MQLRVDVEAARARAEFERTARSVDNLADQLDDAEDQASQARAAFNRAAMELNQLDNRAQAAAREVQRLRSAVQVLGSAAPRELREELRRAEQTANGLQRQVDQGTESLRRMGRAANQAEDEVSRLSDELDDAQRQARQLRDEMLRTQAATRGLGRSLQRGLVGAGRSSALQYMAEFAPAAIAVAPLVGAAIDAALVTAIAGGTLGAGVAIALKKNMALGNLFGDLFGDISEDAGQFSDVFVEPLVNAAHIIRDAWDDVGPQLSSAFSAVAPYVDDLANGLTQLVKNMMPGFLNAVKAGGPLLAQLGEGLADVGDALGSFFDSLADGQGSAKGLDVILVSLAGSIRFVGNSIEGLSNVFDLLTEGLEAIFTTLGKVDGGFKFMGESIKGLNDHANNTREIIDLYGEAATRAEAPQVRMAEAAERAAQAAQTLSDKLHGLISDQLASQQASIAWEKAIDDITEKLKENGRTIDIGTEKGRENTQAVLAAVSAAEAKRQAAINLAGGEHASADAVAAANAAFNAQIGQLAAVLKKAGLTDEQIRTLLGSYQTFANQGDIYKEITVQRKVLGPALGPAFGFRGLASGTDNAKRGWTVVGEEGPEIVFLNGGERVLNARQTAQAVAGGPASGAGGVKGGGVLQVQLVASGGSNDWLFQAVSYGLRTGALRMVASSTGEVRPG